MVEENLQGSNFGKAVGRIRTVIARRLVGHLIGPIRVKRINARQRRHGDFQPMNGQGVPPAIGCRATAKVIGKVSLWENSHMRIIS